MFWLHLSVLVLINVLIAALLVSSTAMRLPLLARAQHVGAGEGAYNVWDLIAQVEAERDEGQDRAIAWPPRSHLPGQEPDDQPTGRHHLRT
ncbi:hypothetical protein ACH347_04885 [Saccharopolyspora sp. 5N102]|uniref:hypothetical protein n=1 Tax=Saccharopolyspora sp. 5N102 TaxID=3375155 RepID=UPI00379901CB